MAESPTILVRARITPDEWTLIRKGALDAGKATSEYVAELLRAGMAARKDGGRGK